MNIDRTVENVRKHLKKRGIRRGTSSRQNSRLVLVLVMRRTDEAEVLRMSPQPNELSFNAGSHLDLLAESSDLLVELVKSKIAGNHLGEKGMIISSLCSFAI